MRGLPGGFVTPAVPVDDVIRRDLLVRSAHQSIQSNLMSLGLVLLVVLSLRAADLGAGLFVWAALAVLNVIQFHLGATWHLRHEPAPGRAQAQQWSFGVLSLIGGVVWGSLTLLAMPSGDQAGLRAVVCTAVMVAMAGNLAFSSPTPVPFLLFHTGLVVLAAAGLFLGGAGSLAAIIIFASGAAIPLQRGLYEHIAQASLVARRNLLLAGELREQRAAVEQTNLRLVEANVELSHRATRDPLTGLANRELFAEHLAASLVRNRQAGTSMSVVYFDLDRFKLINDTLGHAAGDDLLRQVAVRVQAQLRDSDVLARLGGDEFIALIVDGSSPAAGPAEAERILGCFEQPFELSGRTHRVTISLGVAQDDGVSTGEQLVENADAALYRAKALGRNRIEVFDNSLRSSLRARDTDERMFRRMFGGDGTFGAVFEPILDIQRGLIVAAEAVPLWQEGPGSSQSPRALRDLAARTGMASALDEELLLRTVAFGNRLGPGRPSFRVLARLGRSDVGFDDIPRVLGPATGLGVMFAEDQIVSDRGTASRRIQALRDHGLQVLLDDFGRGVSSLSLLQELPLDGVRLHKDVATGALTDAGQQALIAAVVELARPGQLTVTAKGVHSREQLGIVAGLGVQLAQGDLVWSAAHSTGWDDLRPAPAALRHGSPRSPRSGCGSLPRTGPSPSCTCPPRPSR